MTDWSNLLQQQEKLEDNKVLTSGSLAWHVFALLDQGVDITCLVRATMPSIPFNRTHLSCRLSVLMRTRFGFPKMRAASCHCFLSPLSLLVGIERTPGNKMRFLELSFLLLRTARFEIPIGLKLKSSLVWLVR
jgi:hypothetical protein